MKSRFSIVAFVCALILFCPRTGHAQVNPQITGSGAPSGSCTSTQQYLDTTGHNLYYCNNGAWSPSQGLGNLTAGGGGAGATQGNIVTVATNCSAAVLNISCFQVFADGIETPNVAQTWDVVTTSGGSNVSCGLSDCSFTQANIGNLIQATQNCFSTTASVIIARTAITSVTDANHISISPATATSTGSTACARYGHDDTVPLRAAWAVCTANINSKPCDLSLPSGNMFFQKALFVDNAHSNRQYAYSIHGAGATSALWPTTDFDTTTCATGAGGFGNASNGQGSWAIFLSNSSNGGIGSAVPNVDVLKDFTVDGMDIPGNTAGGTGYCGGIAVQRAEIYNVHLWDWMYGGSSLAQGIRLVGPVEVFGLTVNNFGTTGCLTNGSNNATVTVDQSYCTGSVAVCFDVTGVVYSKQSFYGPCGSQSIFLHSGFFGSDGDVIQGLPTFSIKVGDQAAATFNCLNSQLGLTTDVGAPSIYIYSVGTFNIGAGCQLQHSSTGQIFGGLAGGLVTNATMGNTVLGTLLAPQTSAYADLTGTFQGAGCTGVAAASQTIGLYGTGSNVTSTLCTNTTIGAGIRMNHPGKIYQLLVTNTAGGVNASSGLVTVLKNGASQTMVCTIGTGTTGCSDSTVAHFVTFAVGDLISIQFTTQAAETLANVQASLVIQ